MPTPRYAEVALPLPLDRLFTYSIPQALQESAAPGMRVVVPIQNRLETGYIVRLTNSTDVEKVKNLIELPDETPLVSEEMLELSRWVSQYYCCSWGEAIQSTIPSGINARTKKRYTLAPDQLTGGCYSDAQRTIVAAMHRHGGTLTETELNKAVEGPVAQKDVQSLVRRGILLSETYTEDPRVSANTEAWAVLPDTPPLTMNDIAKLQRRAPKQAAVYLDILRNGPALLIRDLCDRQEVTTSAVNALTSKKLLGREDREAYRMPAFQPDERAREKHPLLTEQQTAFETITGAIAARQFETFLLQGITGSGKTEVYLQAIEFALEKGLSAIILVPEISLTPQTVGRFLARFDTRIAVLHSGLGAGERYDEWRRAHRGEVQIVIGARSAIFAPLPNLGIIVVDEEHDSSYKQSDTPRYHARDVAIMRAKLNNAVCVLGSATPSIESYFNTESEKSTRLELSVRATAGKLPEVQVVDMRDETKELGGEVVLSRKLEREIQHRVTEKQQVILLLNRRGHSPFILCPQCGWGAECEHCNVSLTYHAKGNYLLCHYCNARKPVPVICDECQFDQLIYLGAGTQKIEDYLMRAFPGSRVARMDRDTTSRKGAHAEILGAFAKGDVDILIGTQMIAKGHDFPGVTLVGVVNADTGLTLPDFRAAENGFQLLTQVAGRAGRGEIPGTVIIQTYRPKHYAVLAAAQHDYAGFYAQEILHRESAAYPPYRRMANFAVESEDLLEAEKGIALLHRIAREQVEALGYQGLELLGPAPATIHRVNRKYRWNLGAISKSGQRLNNLARAVRESFSDRASRAVKLKIDLDPYGMF